ncbi:MAG: hypothetical protein WBD37_01840 [Anderseniella sp.]
MLSVDVIMLATAQVEHYACHSVRLWQAYCAGRNYEFRRYPDQLIFDMHINWSKIEMVRQHLDQSKADVVVLVDADTYACPNAVGIEELLQGHQDKQIVFASDCRRLLGMPVPLNIPAVLRHRTSQLPNAGFVAIRKGAFSKWFFDEWLNLARNRLSHLANNHPRNQQVLWSGLYFQNIEALGLFDRQVQRIYSSRQIESTRRQGANFIHVKGGLEEHHVRGFIESLESRARLTSDTSKQEV